METVIYKTVETRKSRCISLISNWFSHKDLVKRSHKVIAFVQNLEWGIIYFKSNNTRSLVKVITTCSWKVVIVATKSSLHFFFFNYLLSQVLLCKLVDLLSFAVISQNCYSRLFFFQIMENYVNIYIRTGIPVRVHHSILQNCLWRLRDEGKLKILPIL